MNRRLDRFERITRSVATAPGLMADRDAGAPTVTNASVAEFNEANEPHPFESRNIHPDLAKRVRRLFDDGHWEESVFKAFKFIEAEVKRVSSERGTGYKLMMNVFNEDNPKLRLNALMTESEVDEQKGFKFIFAGAAVGIRNPRGHEVDLGDTPDKAMDYLALASLLLRRIDGTGLR